MINAISLTNYRNLNLELSELADTNIIVAPNGTGKTNLLESIYLLSNGSSFHTMDTTGDLLASESDFAKSQITTDSTKLELTVAKSGSGFKRTYRVNGKNARQSTVAKHLPVILFAPHSVDLVGGDPKGRRDDLDSYLRSLFPEYQEAYKRYYKFLRNRNAFLKIIKEKPAKADELQYWTDGLVATTSDLIRIRLDFFDKIAPFLQQAATEIYRYKEAELEIEYLSKHGTEVDEYLDHLIAKFAEKKALEIEAGQTLYGLHKDDWSLKLNGRPLRFEGSRGQQRIAVFVYKYAQLLFAKTLSQLEEQKITFLVDDIGSELDSQHRELIADFLWKNTNFQSIITATDESQIGKSLAKANRLKLPEID